MFLLPRIQLSKGECVDVLRTSEGEALPLADPKEVAVRFQAMGAVGLHVVDVDAAQGQTPNDEALLSILDSVHIPVQCGGGVRSLKRIQELRDTGARRVFVGTMSALHPDWFREAARCFPQGLVANIDEKDGHVMVKGRSQDSGRRVEDVLAEVDALGLEGVVITSLNGSTPERLVELSRGRRTPVMVHARFRDMAELATLREAGVRAAILGGEIYDRTIDFGAACQYFKTA